MPCVAVGLPASRMQCSSSGSSAYGRPYNACGADGTFSACSMSVPTTLGVCSVHSGYASAASRVRYPRALKSNARAACAVSVKRRTFESSTEM